uniref:Uncharacterized protein n=1 Tax=Arundo donax TaxID=35708 RepID=A0A0A9HPX0_ARUDO
MRLKTGINFHFIDHVRSELCHVPGLLPLQCNEQ